jgi:hypothetical protein
MALPSKIFHSNGFDEYKSAQALWNALSEKLEGNSDLKEGKKELLQRQFDVINYFPGETLDAQVTRLNLLLSKMRKMGIDVNESQKVKKLYDSLPPTWSTPCMMIKRIGDGLTGMTLNKFVASLQSYELDAKKRETNAGMLSENAGSALYASVTNSTNASHAGYTPYVQGLTNVAGATPQTVQVAAPSQPSTVQSTPSGNLTPMTFQREDLEQINPDDLEEMDLH